MSAGSGATEMLPDELKVIAELSSGSDSLLRVLGDLQRFGATLKRLSWSDAQSGATARLEFAGSPTIETDSLVQRLARHPGVHAVALASPTTSASSRAAS
jgi:hypothetical protein